MRSIKSTIIVGAMITSVALFSGSFVIVYGQYRAAIQENAIQNGELLSRQTFNAMYQVMRLGWSRAQLEEFLEETRKSFKGTSVTVEIHRGPRVDALFGTIEQPVPGLQVATMLTSGGEAQAFYQDESLRYLSPIAAREECLRCHVNVAAGDVLGVIEVNQDLSAPLAAAERRFLFSFLPIVPFALVIAVILALLVSRRLQRSVRQLHDNIQRVNNISDLTALTKGDIDLGFTELNAVVNEFDILTERIHQIAVDRDLLEFEVRLLERFVITADVVRDWREYVKQLLLDINQVLPAYAMFSIFKSDEEQYELEVFWRARPLPATRQFLEEQLYEQIGSSGIFVEASALSIRHNIADPSSELLSIDPETVMIQTKSLLVEQPKIGGIVGIGVNAEEARDQMRMLVVESVLSTLLNVVGSIKAIYHYTQELEYYATRDPLTHLYNQRLFWELLGYEIGRADRGGYKFAVMVIDCDNFKSLNDTYGHSFGDDCLCMFADAIRKALRGPDILCRYGGDEFVVILPEAGDSQSATVGERVREAIHSLDLIAPGGSPVSVTVSIGVSIYPDHASEPKDLFMFADNMMYRAKSEGKDRLSMPTSEDVIEIFKRIGEKGVMINNAIEQRRVIPYFQPICTSADSVVMGYEVLSRIDLAEDGHVITAREFVETAEQMGVIHKLDFICFEKAFAQVRDKQYEGLLFLNLSPKNLIVKEFLHQIRKLVRQYQMDPERIVFEITERETVRNLALLKNFLSELRADGFKFAIDDFGTGFSSIHFLKHFPIDFIKIEGEFIANMMRDTHDLAFVRSIASLAADVGIISIAEFIEDEDISNAVRECGVELAQGFYIGRPQSEIGLEPDGIGRLDAG